MNRRRQLMQRAMVALVVATAGVFWLHSREPATPEAAIEQSVRTFVEHLEFGRINKAVRMLDPAFTFNGYSRGDISRGLVMNQRDTKQLTISLLDLRVTLDEVTGRATATMGVAATFFRAGHEVALGQDEPIGVAIVYEQQGREWVPIKGEGDQRIEMLGYPF